MKKKFFSVIVIVSLAAFISCKKDKESEPVTGSGSAYKYVLSVALPALESYPFHVLQDIESGVADINESQEIPGIEWSIPVTGKDGFIIMNSADKLTKYIVNDEGILSPVGSTANTGVSSGPISEYLDNDRLIVTTAGRPTTNGIFNYQIINVRSMTQESSGTITLPTAETHSSSLQGYIVKEGKLYTPYIHGEVASQIPDSATVAVFDASTMTFEKVISSDKTACVGYSVVSSYGFDEHGDLYITSCNSGYWGGNESKPSGILRINAGSSDFDKDYFFNLTQALNGNHTGGMLYVGSNKAIVQVFRSDLIKEYSDYTKSFVIEYHLVDLKTKTTQKLDIPLSRHPRHTMQRLKNGKSAIAVNAQSGSYIYIYDPATQSVKQGLTYNGAETIEAFKTIE